MQSREKVMESIFHLGLKLMKVKLSHSLKSSRIWSYSGPHFPVFGLNTERFGVSVRIQSECGKIRTRITPNMDTFHVGSVFSLNFEVKLISVAFSINKKGNRYVT